MGTPDPEEPVVPDVDEPNDTENDAPEEPNDAEDDVQEEPTTTSTVNIPSPPQGSPNPPQGKGPVSSRSTTTYVCSSKCYLFTILNRGVFFPLTYSHIIVGFDVLVGVKSRGATILNYYLNV